MRRAGLVAGAALRAATLGVSPAQAATFQVINNLDSGVGSLRDAIASANAASGDDTITFANTVTGTITLTSGSLSVNPATTGDALTITGPGKSVLAVSGDATGDGMPEGASRVTFASRGLLRMRTRSQECQLARSGPKGSPDLSLYTKRSRAFSGSGSCYWERLPKGAPDAQNPS